MAWRRIHMAVEDLEGSSIHTGSEMTSLGARAWLQRESERLGGGRLSGDETRAKLRQKTRVLVAWVEPERDTAGRPRLAVPQVGVARAKQASRPVAGRFLLRAGGRYGTTDYADPGYQPDGKPRYPLVDPRSRAHTIGRVRSAWTRIHQRKSRRKYTAPEVRDIEMRILRAGRALGINFVVQPRDRRLGLARARRVVGGYHSHASHPYSHPRITQHRGT